MQAALETEAKGKAEAIRMRRNWKLMQPTLDLLLNMLLLEMLKLKIPSKSISFKLEMLRLRLMKNLRPNLLQLMLRSLLTVKRQQCKMLLKKAVLSLRLLIAKDALLSKNWQTPMKLLLSWEMSTNPLLLQRGSWNLSSTNREEILMRCPMKPGFQKTRLPELWLKLLVLLTSEFI